MSVPEHRSARRPPPRRRHPLLRLGLRLLVLALVFAVGIALGQTLDDNPDPERGQTLVRTLKPQPLAPAVRTVTVTRP